MITVEEAKNIIQSNTVLLSPVTAGLADAMGKVLAATLLAPVHVPAFPQSAMDGYAFAYHDLLDLKDGALSVVAILAAGNDQALSLQEGQAARIFTGAAVPEGADTVVMQEKTSVQGNRLMIEDPQLTPGSNVRPAGSEIRSGEPALEKGTLLTPAAIGFLAATGFHEVPVYPNPVVTIIVTGKELCPPGQPLTYGQVYQSNSYALQAALLKAGIAKADILFADDEPELITATLQAALAKSDLVLLTGGVSVGDFDFVLEAAAGCGVTTLFHKIKQRPGKPLFFGKKGERLVFGLPGNPASALTCFYEYVLPAIGLQTARPLALKSLMVTAKEQISKKHSLVHFLKGYYDGSTVLSLDAQESYRLRSFAMANCLIVLEEDRYSCERGELAEVHLLP